MPITAEEKMRRQQERARRIAEQQQRAAGYARTPGYDPTPAVRQRYLPEAQRTPTVTDTPPLGVSQGVISTPEQERQRRRKAAQGKTLTNADL